MRIAFAALALLFLAPLARAQQGVPDGSYWRGGGKTIRVDVTDTPAPGVDVTTIGAGGFSQPVVGTPGANSTPLAPTCYSSPTMTLQSGEKFTCGSGRMWRWEDDPELPAGGSWKPMRRIAKQPRPNGAPGVDHFQWAIRGAGGPGEDVTGLPD